MQFTLPLFGLSEEKKIKRFSCLHRVLSGALRLLAASVASVPTFKGFTFKTFWIYEILCQPNLRLVFVHTLFSSYRPKDVH